LTDREQPEARLEPASAHYLSEARLCLARIKKRNEPHICWKRVRSSHELTFFGIGLRAIASSVLEALNQHRQAIAKRVRYRNRCGRCEANGGFTRHDLRRRWVRVIVDRTVQVYRIVVARWRCSRCGHVFTDLPDFPAALPAIRQRQPAPLGT